MEAVTQDDALAAMTIRDRDDEEPAPPRRRMSEWSVEVELLSAMVDRLAEVIQAIAASSGAKPSKITPQPRPKTAYERVRGKDRVRRHHALVLRVLPAQEPDQANDEEQHHGW